MNLVELYNIVEREMIRCPHPEDIRVCIPIQTLNAIGGTPCVDIKSIHPGHDWNSCKLMLYPEKDLSLTDNAALAKMRKEAQEMGWTAYEVTNLKREIKSLRKRLGDQE